MSTSSSCFKLCVSEVGFSCRSNRSVRFLGSCSFANFSKGLRNWGDMKKCRFAVRKLGFRIACELRADKEVTDDQKVFEISSEKITATSSLDGEVKTNFAPELCNGHSGGGDSFGSGGGGVGGGGGGWGGGENENDDEDAKEFGPLLKFSEVMREVEARGAKLPADMFEAAKKTGIRKFILERYLDLQGSVWPLGAATRSLPMLRNRLLADPTFLFKVGTEIVIDTCCATFAEVQKRGKDFWNEFELYVADMLVGVVVNIALVGMLAPYTRFGSASASGGFFARMLGAYNALPSSVFEAERPGSRFSVQQRISTYFYKGIMYGVVGFSCGIIGQGIANMIMTLKRQINKSEHDVPVPPLLKSAALWGFFLAVSSNTRYQIINGLERIVEASPVAKRVPPVALAFTVGVRFANNVYAGMQFVDWARLSGVQ